MAEEYLITHGSPSAESREIVRDVLAGLAGGRELAVLDLGCGNGALYGYLAEAGLPLRYTGVDFSEPLLAVARSRNRDAEFLLEDVESLTGLEGPFDVVVYSHVLEMLESPQASLRRAAALAPTCLIRFFEPPEHDVEAVELREMDVGNKIVPYIRRRMSRDYYRLLLADVGCESVDVYRCEGSTDQVHVLQFGSPALADGVSSESGRRPSAPFEPTSIARWVADFATASPPGRVLDVGCGTRPYEGLFADWDYVGIDVEESGRPNEFKKVDEFFDGVSIPYPDASFDAVLCTEVLEHCAEPGRLASEMCRVLKPGGAAVITVPFMWGEHEAPYDFRRYSSFGVTQLLESAGLLIEAIDQSERGVDAVKALVSSEINNSLRSAGGAQPNRLHALARFAERYLWAAVQRIWRSEYRFSRIYIDNLVVARRPEVVGDGISAKMAQSEAGNRRGLLGAGS